MLPFKEMERVLKKGRKLVIWDMEDGENIYSKIYDTLKPGGIFLFNIEQSFLY